MDYESCLNRLRENAATCRRLADRASDPEAVQALRQMAADIDAALPILEDRCGNLDGPPEA